MPSIQQFFKWGLDRDIPDLLEPPAYRSLAGGYDDLRGRKFYTIPEAARVDEEMGLGGELPWINLGPGDKKIVQHRYERPRSEGFPTVKATVGVGPETNKLTQMKWVYPKDLPYEDESVGAVHAHQFLEHFDGDDAIGILREIERVLVPGGVAFLTVPYQGTSHWGQALDHKSSWNEETWAWLFNNEYYDHQGEPWRLKVHACFIMGIVIRNLDLFTQLVKE